MAELLEDLQDIEESFSYDYNDRFLIEDNLDRRLYINCEISNVLIDLVAHHILRFNRMDKDIPVEQRKPIRLYINSPGGTVTDGYGIVDAIVASKTPVYTINLAMADSMALLIFIAGHKRYTMPHAEFLLHSGSTSSLGSANAVKDQIEFESIQIEGMTKQYVLEHTKIDNNLYEQKRRFEWYFLAEEAKQIGVADYIVGKDCDIDDIL